MTKRKENPNGGTRGAGKTPGSGRKKGTVNKHTAELKAMIEGALHAVGGQEYLEQQARINPESFLSLLGKTLPKDLKVAASLKLVVNLVNAQRQPAN